MSLLGVFVAGAFSAPVSAAPGTPFNPENKIHVYGRVSDVHSVTVDANNRIIEIASNTDKDTVPRVFRERVSKETQIDLTAEVYNAYLKLVPPGTSRVGILYQRIPVIDVKIQQPESVFEDYSIIDRLQAAAQTENDPFI